MSHGAALALAATGLVAAATGPLALSGVLDDSRAYAVSTVVVSASLLAAGATLLDTSRGRRVGLALLVTGALWPGCWAALDQHGVGPFASWVDGTVLWLVVGTGLLGYPDTLERSRRERGFLLVMWVFVCGGAAVLTLLSRPGWLGLPTDAWWPTGHPTRQGFAVALLVFALGRVALAGAGSLLLVSRLRAASGLDRAVFRPALVGVVVAVVVVAATGVVQLRQVSPQVHATMTFLQGLALLVVPVVLAVTAFQNRLRKAQMVDAMMGMPRPSTPESVRAALRATLHDDSVEVLFWVPETHSLVDLSGRPVLAPEPGTRFQAAVHGSDGQPLGLITADPRLANHERLVDVVVSAAALEIENAALHTALLTQVEQMHDSSSLKAEVAEAERHRLERDLHDGAQQHMLALALRVEHARQQATDADTRRRLGLIRSDLQRALGEMRALAHGLRPQALDSGLGPALARLAGGMSVPVRVDAEPQSLDPEAETTAYFVACEALSNVTKHARATHVSVCVRSIGDQLLLSVTDDGTGGARPARGTGLQGLVARVEASGGRLRITSPPGRGTRIEARIPCG